MNITKQWQILLHNSVKFGRGRYPDSRYVVFSYWDIGPLQIRRYACAGWDLSAQNKDVNF